MNEYDNSRVLDVWKQRQQVRYGHHGRVGYLCR